MSRETVAVELPVTLFERLRSAADLTHRSIEDIAATSLESALTPTPDVPAEISDELAGMGLLSDDALRAAAEPSFSPREDCRLRQLNSAADGRGLSTAERLEQQELVASFRRSVLRRAKALAILAQRGYPFPPGDATAGDAHDAE